MCVSPSVYVVFSALGDILVNEIASVGKPEFCAGADYIELYNSDATPVNIAGYVLSNSSSTFTIPPGAVIPPRGFKTYCQGFPGSFTFGIGSMDTISLKLPNGDELFSTTLDGLGTRSRTYQRLRDGSYGNGPPSPNAPNSGGPMRQPGGLRRLGLLCPECCGWFERWMRLC
jgi:Lamin Tail Domain